MNLAAPPAGFHDDPYPAYAALREAGATPQPDGSVILARYADLEAVYKDTNTYLSDKKAVFAPKFGEDAPLYSHHTTSLVFNDAPLHGRVRRIMTGALTPRALKALEPGLQTLVDGLLDRLADGDDLIEHFAGAIPVEVIGNLLDIPRAERGPLRNWSLAILGALEPALSEAELDRGNRAVTDFSAYLDGLVARRRARPGDPETDVLTRLIVADEGGGLAQLELIQNCIFILNAGHETTTNLIGNALWLLDHDRDARAALLAELGLISGAVDEVLRLESPNQFGNRLTAKPVTLHGTRIPEGTDLHLCIGAANRDPAAFDAPERLDPARKPARHLAFAAGPHTCVGLTLARMEGRIALERFLARFPDYAVLPGAERSRRIRFRGFARLPVQLRSPL